MKRAVIFSNGEYNNYDYLKNLIKSDDYIVCADGAIAHCLNMGILPDLWIGDFDSCNISEIMNSYPELSKVKQVKLDCRKDETDTHIACNMACEHGCDTVVILGAFGKRLDHMLANISLLENLASKDVTAYLENEKNRISFLRDEIKIKKSKKYLSIVPVDSCVTVETASGVEYTLKNEKLFRNKSRGVSNEITADYAYIKLSEGNALIIESDD